MKTLCAVRPSVPKRPRRYRLQPTIPVVLPSRVPERKSWNTWIVIGSLIVIVALVLFMEHHIRGLTVHSGMVR